VGIVLVYFNPSPQKRLFLRFLPYCFATPRNATGHGKGEVDARFAAVAVFSTPPSFGHLPYILFGNKTQGRSLKVTLYSYRLSHNNGERRGKFFAKNVFFAILVAQKGGKNYGETSIFRLGLEFGE
jgi:hypothetical protein